MDNALILLTFLLAVVLALKSPAKAFYDVYLPALMFFPMVNQLWIPNVPHPNINQAAIIAITVIYLLFHRSSWRWSIMDILILGFTFSTVFSEYLNTSFVKAEHFAFYTLGSVVFPYAMAKALIEPSGMRIPVSKRLVFMLFVLAVISAYQFRMGVNPFISALKYLIPDGNFEDIDIFQMRWGYLRITGPFFHSIIFGGMLTVAIIFQLWLKENALWSSKRKTQVLMLGLFGGLLMTFARGPWAGLAIALVFIFLLKRFGNPVKITNLCIALASTGIVLFILLAKTRTAQGSRGTRYQAEEFSSINYRIELINKYSDVLVRGGLWGYGSDAPLTEGMKSIDNEFLRLGLNFGAMGLGLFLLMGYMQLTRLANYRNKKHDPLNASFALTLMASLVCIAATISTVALLVQLQALFFILFGWSESLLIESPEKEEAPAVVPRDTRATPFQFKRILT